MSDEFPAARPHLDHGPPAIVAPPAIITSSIVDDRYDSGPAEQTVDPDHPTDPPNLLAGRYDRGALSREKTVRGQFVRDVLGAERLSPLDKEQILLVGLLALDGADDLEVR